MLLGTSAVCLDIHVITKYLRVNWSLVSWNSSLVLSDVVTLSVCCCGFIVMIQIRAVHIKFCSLFLFLCLLIKQYS